MDSASRARWQRDCHTQFACTTAQWCARRWLASDKVRPGSTRRFPLRALAERGDGGLTEETARQVGAERRRHDGAHG
jgi:hypothetical protein